MEQQREKRKDPATGRHACVAIAVQEHNMSPAKHDEYTRMAVASNMDLHIWYDTPGRDGTHWGGSLMLVDLKNLPVLELRAVFAASKLAPQHAGRSFQGQFR